jgi:hypothetical protein
MENVGTMKTKGYTIVVIILVGTKRGHEEDAQRINGANLEQAKELAGAVDPRSQTSKV